ncbi:hypothetical protein B0O80DRAFT_439159 [Mortierella sp. GBAus27b]|nr:hypothetical protein B0O80DRAFT_439159 [Mortierella sp. GBAus27b]
MKVTPIAAVLFAVVSVVTAAPPKSVLSMAKTQAVCSADACTDLCNQVFPNRGCHGTCLSDTECQCTCDK